MLYLNTCINPIQTFEGITILTQIDNAFHGLGDWIRSWTSPCFPLFLPGVREYFACLFFQIVPFFFDFIWGPNGNSQWAGLLSYLSPYFFFLFVCNYIWVLWIYGGILFSTSLSIKTTSSLLKLHFFSLVLSREGGLSQPYLFFYLSAARIEQGVVRYIGPG